MDTGSTSEKVQGKSYDRRDFFREAFRLVGRNVVEYVDTKVEEKKTQVKHLTTTTVIKKPEFRSKRLDFLRPPGAHDEALFTKHCKTCNLCVSACPRSAITKAGPDYGAIEGTPVIIPRRAPCVLCADLTCTKACKSGVLVPLDQATDVRIGLAEINERNCPAYDGVSNCSLCHIKCPLSDLAIYLDDFKPTVNKDVCTGCGVCESACSTINSTPAIRIRPRILEDVGANLVFAHNKADPSVRP